MADLSLEIMPHVRNLTSFGANCDQYLRFYASDDSDSNCEFVDCEVIEKYDATEVNSEGFVIKDAYFEDRDMEQLEFVSDPAIASDFHSKESKCAACQRFRFHKISETETEIMFDPGTVKILEYKFPI